MNAIQRQRYSSTIQKLASEIYLKEMRSEYDCLLTFVSCDLSTDGMEAKIAVSIFGDITESEKAWNRLKKSSGYFAGRISRKMRLRSTPKFIFIRQDFSENIESNNINPPT